MWETWVQSLIGKIPWRRGWQHTPVFLPGESPQTEEPGRLQSKWLQRVGHDWATKHSYMIENYWGNLIRMVQEGNSEKRTQAENYEGASREAEWGGKFQAKRTLSVKKMKQESVLMPRKYFLFKSWDEKVDTWTCQCLNDFITNTSQAFRTSNFNQFSASQKGTKGVTFTELCRTI